MKRPTKKQIAEAREVVAELRRRIDDAQVRDSISEQILYESRERAILDELLRADDPLLDWAIGWARKGLKEGAERWPQRIERAVGT